MSMRDKVQISCPSCSHQFEVERWSAINGSLNPVQKAELLDGSLFFAQCPDCGKKFMLGYPVVYNDTENKVMIWLVFSRKEIVYVTDCYNDSKNEFDEFDERIDESYKRRIVLSPDRLREKIMIFDSGLDDKIVEIAKIAYANSAKQQLGGDEIAEVYFTSGHSDGENRLEMFTKGGKAVTAILSKNVYDDLEKRYGSKACFSEGTVYVIDESWAINLLK